MNVTEQIDLIRSTGHLHGDWYRETYPDVADLDPALHYLLYGAAMGRNPGQDFDTKFYARNLARVGGTDINPLVHYALGGREKGYPTRPPLRSAGLSHVGVIRTKLFSLGFIERAHDEMRSAAVKAKSPSTRAHAARDLAMWHMRKGTAEDYGLALDYLAASHREGMDLAFRRKLAVAAFLCHCFRQDPAAARACYEQAAQSGEISDDLLLALGNLDASPELRLTRINQVLAHHCIAPLSLLARGAAAPYDRLTAAGPLPWVAGGPKVTVLVAAHEAAATLPTALRSLLEQTWRNLEILVVDDASPSPGTRLVAESFAARDPRIRLIRQEQNGGAYVARNRGLTEATGDYVTLQDADDWSHPLRIETQVSFMEANAPVMGCTVQQARADNDLGFFRITQGCNLITSNTSSFMWRRRPVVSVLEGWDEVRFEADSDLMKRVAAIWGDQAVARLPSGPLSFQRNDRSSTVNDPATAAESLPFGLRRDYLGLRRERTAAGRLTALKGEAVRAPLRMRPVRTGYDQVRHFGMILASDFRMQGGNTHSCLQEIRANKSFGLRTGIVQMYRYDFPPDRPMEQVIREEIDEDLVQLLAYGDRVTCDLLILRYPPAVYHRQLYLPQIDAGHVKVIVNQPPLSDYGSKGVVRYELDKCAENIRHHFGKDALWHPIGPLIREALQDHHKAELDSIELSDQDWCNIIDIADWDRGTRKRGPADRLRIGRHSRDHAHKWPDRAEDILALYPPADDLEVHILGGATAPQALIGAIPENWQVHDFDSLTPREFLREIDVWIYFPHPDWLESFGRTIIEAMATGVPVILPEMFRSLLQDAALYATPQTAVQIARELHADPVSYDRQVRRAQAYVRDRFSYEMHRARLGAAGVSFIRASSAAPEVP